MAFQCLIVHGQRKHSSRTEQIKTLGGGISPKLTAGEMAALGRYMPILLYDLVDTTDDELWQFLVKIQTIVDYAFAPKHSATTPFFLSFTVTIKYYFRTFFPGMPVKPK